MSPRIFIIFATSAFILMEFIFLPCAYVNTALVYRPEAGFHTSSGINTEMRVDEVSLAFEVAVTLVVGIAVFAAAQSNTKIPARKTPPRTWRSAKL